MKVVFCEPKLTMKKIDNANIFLSHVVRFWIHM